MDKNIGLYLKIGGIVLGAVATILLITRHPILIGMNILGAGLYFVGEYIRKNG